MISVMCMLALTLVACNNKVINRSVYSIDFTKPVSENKSQSTTFSTSAHLCPKVPIEELKPHLYSQKGEDETLLKWFNELCGGTYIEMGALDGLKFSNTYVFNRMFDWRGVLIELSPVSYKQLVKNRPNEIATVNAAVCSNQKTIHWYQASAAATSGIWEFTAASYRERWWANARLEDTTPIECVPLQDILTRHAPNHAFFDIFSLDVEGAEFEVLQSLDFDKVGFGMIVVESDKFNPNKNLAVSTLLETSGYRMVQRLKNNDIMVNKEFGRIYKDLATESM